MTLNEAIEEMVKRGGMTRRQAKRRLLAALQSGPSTGFLVRPGPGGEEIATGRREEIPAEFWQGKPLPLADE